MNKIGLIIEREYMVRVKKKSFIVMTILGPILMAAMIILPAVLMNMSDETDKKIAVIDESGTYSKVIQNTDALVFDFNPENKENIKEKYSEMGYYGVLFIPDSFTNEYQVQLFSDKQPSMGIKSHISKSIEAELETRFLNQQGIDQEILKNAKKDVSVETFLINEQGSEQESFTEISMAIGFIAAIIIYMFIFIYGAQVMRGVIEEKSSRIVEIMVSSVRPFELMMGKILGIALVVITQVTLWIILTFAIVLVAKSTFMPDITNPTQITQTMGAGETEKIITEQASNGDFGKIMNAVMQLNFPLLIGGFIFFFFGGYLLYSSIFAAIGAAVDNETDTQQFMMPIVIPLVVAFMMAQNIIQNPDGALAFWFSIIPFTSPIIMMVRIPFGVPTHELILSGVILIATFIFTTWLAGRIYRVGILVYGKKVGYKDLFKWLFYNN